MKENRVKRVLQQGGTVVGTMVFEFATPGIARIAAAAGAEFAVFDMEHTGWSVETVRTLIATSRPAELVPIVRVPAAEYHFIARVLDMGAMGVMVPMVESAGQAQRIVQSAKYPPAGRRGAAFGLAHDGYQSGDLIEKMRSADRETLLIAQIETAAGMKNLDEIAAVDGIDVLWVGQYDLTNSLGIPGQFTHPDLLRALDRVLDACQRHGRIPAVMSTSDAEAATLLKQGFRCLAWGGDLWIYQEALARGIAAAREQAAG